MRLLRDGEQLKLKFEGWPWEGQAPRTLTKSYFQFIFESPAPATGVSDSPTRDKMITDLLQLDLLSG